MLKTRIKQVRKYLDIGSQKEFAARLQWNIGRIQDLESGKVKELKASEAEEIQDKFLISGWWLLTGRGEMLVNAQNKLPSIGKSLEEDDSVSVNYYPDVIAAAGYGAINEGQYIPQPMHLDRKFLEQIANVRHFDKLDIITVFGDSMEPYISNGETVLIERNDDAKNGETVIANINGSIYIKRIKMDPFKKWVKLLSENSHYEEIVLDGEALQYLTIVGIVRAKIRIF